MRPPLPIAAPSVTKALQRAETTRPRSGALLFFSLCSRVAAARSGSLSILHGYPNSHISGSGDHSSANHFRVAGSAAQSPESCAAASSRFTESPYTRCTATTRPANQHRFRSGRPSPASFPLLWKRFTSGEASAGFRRSVRTSRRCARPPRPVSIPSTLRPTVARRTHAGSLPA